MTPFARSGWFAGLALLATLAGCQQRQPQFILGEQTKALVPVAQDLVKTELESAFGTPTNLTVWRALPVDFGEFGGVVSDTTGNQVSVKLEPASATAATRRLSTLRGAVLVKDGATSGVRVASYTPDNHTLTVESTAEAGKGDTVKVVGDGLQFGRDLYLRHCMHCHGVSGDGDGPTAKYFAVRPRDYRQGKFKFTSTKVGVNASRDDLKRIIKLGAPGTYMPSFMLLPDDEIAAIVEYVRWLALRGQMERGLFDELQNDYSQTVAKDKSKSELKADLEKFAKDAMPEKVTEIATALNEGWTAAEAEDSVVVPETPRVEASDESIARGRALFMHKDIACFNCHGETGRGNGPSTEIKKEGAKGPGLFDDWGNQVKPRDLTSGIYRGGRRPLDVYRRIRAGIKGTPMQAFSKLKDEEVWDLTNYVLSMPYKSKPAKAH